MTRGLLALAALYLATSSTATPAMPFPKCSARFLAAQRDGSANRHDWDSFHESVCGSATGTARSSVRRATDLDVRSQHVV